MARPNVPEFGKWENEENDVPYTVYFNNARKNKGGKGSGKMINPNEHPELFADAAAFVDPPSRHRPQPDEPVRRGGNKSPKPQPPPREAKENEEFKQQFADSPVRYRNGGRAGAAAANDSPHHQYGEGRGTGGGRPTRPSAGSEHSFEKSPLHPQQRAGLYGRGSDLPSVEGKRSVGTPHGTPSRLKPKTRHEAPGRDVIPQFGDWDVNDPQSADNFTYIFNKNAKNASAHEPNTTPSPPRSPRKAISDDSVKFQCCFAWSKK